MEVRLSLDEVRDLATRTLLHLGASRDNADAVADVITAAERDDCKSHGLFRLPGYAVALRNGRIDGKAVPVVAELAPGVVQVDARGGFAPLAGAFGVGKTPSESRCSRVLPAALARVTVY